MLLLADENFPRSTVDALRRDGHDVVWVRTDAPGSKDAALLKRAETEARLMLTLDKDFWLIALQLPQPLSRSGLILFRIHPATPHRLTPLVLSALHAGHDWAGHISIVTVDAIQMLPSRKRLAR